jgi:hypothetical protein
MLAVEVFAGKVPFEEKRDEAVVLHIVRGGRPEVPQNAQALGLTALLESCWQPNPKKRPTMQQVVKKCQRLVGNDDDLVAFPECV